LNKRIIVNAAPTAATVQRVTLQQDFCTFSSIKALHFFLERHALHYELWRHWGEEVNDPLPNRKRKNGAADQLFLQIKKSLL